MRRYWQKNDSACRKFIRNFTFLEDLENVFGKKI